MYWMIDILAMGMDCLSAMLLLIPAALVFQKMAGRKIFCLHTFFLLLYVCALAGIFAVTGLPTLKYIRFDLSLNMIPMLDILSSPRQYALNVLMFVPIGFLLPILWEKYRDWKSVLGFGCFLTLFIEIAQVFTFRATDIDDLITNILGTAIGWMTVRYLSRKLRVPLPDGGAGAFHPFDNPWSILLLVFLINFFIQPWWSAFLWDSLLL